MKALLFISILASHITFGQAPAQQKKTIDSLVATIDNDPHLTNTTFNIQALKKVLHYIDYQYAVKDGLIVKIARRFGRNKDSTTQQFYFRKDQLIYATETINSYYSGNSVQDTMTWSANYYFSNGKLIDQITLGHGKSEMDSWDPQAEVFSNCKDAKRDILRYNKMKK